MPAGLLSLKRVVTARDKPCLDQTATDRLGTGVCNAGCFGGGSPGARPSSHLEDASKTEGPSTSQLWMYESCLGSCREALDCSRKPMFGELLTAPPRRSRRPQCFLLGGAGRSEVLRVLAILVLISVCAWNTIPAKLEIRRSANAVHGLAYCSLDLKHHVPANEIRALQAICQKGPSSLQSHRPGSCRAPQQAPMTHKSPLRRVSNCHFTQVAGKGIPNPLQTGRLSLSS